MKYPDQSQVNWKYILIFYLIAFGISAPVNSGYLADAYNNLTQGTIFYKSAFLPAGLGTFIAALLAFRLDRNFPKKITTFWGNTKLKNILIAIVPLVVFTITGIPNDLNKNVHLYAFQISFVLVIYALSEEIFWRGYLINALSPLGKLKNYLILGTLWWAWHFPFTRADGYTSFLIIILVSSLLIGKFVEGTRSYLTVAGLHSLIVIIQLGNNKKPMMYAGGVIILIWILLDKCWKTDEQTLLIR